MSINLIELESYYDLTFEQREKVIISISKQKKFFETYFNNLKNARTSTECFNKLNDLHFEIYGSYMYSSFCSFSIVYSRNLKKKKK